MIRRYPLQPLADALGVSLASLGRHLSVSGTQWQQYRDQGVTERVADRLAVKAGYAPAEVWPELLDHAIEDAEAADRERRESARPRKNAAARRKYAEDAGFRARRQAEMNAYKAATRRAQQRYARQYREANRDRLAEQRRANYIANRDRILERQRAYDRARAAERRKDVA